MTYEVTDDTFARHGQKYLGTYHGACGLVQEADVGQGKVEQHSC